MRHSVLLIITTAVLIGILYSCKGTETPAPGLDVTTGTVNADAAGGVYQIHYVLTDAVESALPAASAPGAEEWIGDFDLSQPGTVTFTVASNESNSARQATIHLTYGELSGKTIVTQSSKPHERYDVEFEATLQSRGIYYGDMYSPSTGNYFVTFSNDKTSGNQDNYVHPGGTYYTIDLYGEMWDGDMSSIGLPEGYYELDPSNSLRAGTFSQTYGQYAKADDEGNIAVSMRFLSGSCTVSMDGGNYDIDMSLTLEDSSRHHLTYNGPIVCEMYQEGPGYEYIEEDIDFEMNIAQAIYQAQDGSVLLQFTDMSADAGGTVLPPGTLLNIQAYMDVAQDGCLQPTTLTQGGDKSTGTFLPGSMTDYSGIMLPGGTYAQYYFSNTHVAYGIIAGGTVSLKGGNGVYDIDIDLITSEGRHIRSSQSSVTLPLYGWNPDDDPMTTLSDDYETDLRGASASATYYGDYYNNGGDNWIVRLTPTTGMDGFQLEYVGKGLQGFDSGLPTGTFMASDNGEPGTYIVGSREGTDLYSTWYLGGYDEYGNVSQFAPAMNGTVSVNRNTDGTYSIEFDLYDDAPVPNNFTGNWTGAVNLKDAYSAGIPARTGSEICGQQPTGPCAFNRMTIISY